MTYPGIIVKRKKYNILLLVVSLGCKKPHEVIPVTVTCNTVNTFQIEVNGSSFSPMDVMAGDTVNFQASVLKLAGAHTYYSFEPGALAGCMVSWSFGDGASSAELSPEHVYDSSGTYLVQMVLNGDSANVLSRSVYIGPPPIYAQSIAGNWQWKRTRVVTDGPTNITDTIIADTAFAINIVDKESVAIGATVLSYLPGSSTSQLSLYLSTGGFPICSLLYYPSTNRILYTVDYGWRMTDRFELR